MRLEGLSTCCLQKAKDGCCIPAVLKSIQPKIWRLSRLLLKAPVPLLGTHTLAVAATQAGPAGTPAGTQYAFSAWSDGGAASHTITVGASAASFTASFTTQYQLTMAASPAAGGTVTPATGGFYNAGTPVAIGATAGSGYTFQNWTGSGVAAAAARRPR